MHDFSQCVLVHCSSTQAFSQICGEWQIALYLVNGKFYRRRDMSIYLACLLHYHVPQRFSIIAAYFPAPTPRLV